MCGRKRERKVLHNENEMCMYVCILKPCASVCACVAVCMCPEKFVHVGLCVCECLFMYANTHIHIHTQKFLTGEDVNDRAQSVLVAGGLKIELWKDCGGISDSEVSLCICTEWIMHVLMYAHADSYRRACIHAFIPS